MTKNTGNREPTLKNGEEQSDQEGSQHSCLCEGKTFIEPTGRTRETRDADGGLRFKMVQLLYRFAGEAVRLHSRRIGWYP